MTTLSLNATASRTNLTADDATQVVYVLLEPRASSDAPRYTPTHCCLIVDCSPSMRIPIADDTLFRQLVRRGQAQEVMVDGLPAWKISSEAAHDVRQQTTSPSQWVAQAVGGISERLHPLDRLSIVGFATNAHALVRHASPTELNQIKAAINHVERGDFGDSTMLAPAMQKTLDILHQYRNDQRTERVILVTDGFVEDAAASGQIARAIAEAAIPCSTIGLGVEFQEQLLMHVADQSGGHATFINHPEAIPAMLNREFERNERIVVQRVRLEARLAKDVAIRRVYRVRPILAELAQPTITDQTASMSLGNLEHHANDAVLVELLVPARPAQQYRLARFSLNGVDANGTKLDPAHAELIVTYERDPRHALNPALVSIIERVTAWRMHNKALDAAAQGDNVNATRQLEAAITRLVNIGADDLAQQTANITQQITTTGVIDTAQIKELRYATRKLGKDDA